MRPRGWLLEANSLVTRAMVVRIGKSEFQFCAVRGASRADEPFRCLGTGANVTAAARLNARVRAKIREKKQ
jgi:hypothetical protein